MGVEQTYRTNALRIKPGATSGTRYTGAADGSTLAEYWSTNISPAVLGLFNKIGSNRIVRVKRVSLVDASPPISLAAAGQIMLGRVATGGVTGDSDNGAGAWVNTNTSADFVGMQILTHADGTVTAPLRKIPVALDFPAWSTTRPIVMTGSTPHTIGLMRYPSADATPIMLRSGDAVALTDTGTEGRWRQVTAHFSDGTDTWVSTVPVYFLGASAAPKLQWVARNSSANPIYLTRLEIDPISYWTVTSTTLFEVCRCSGMFGGLVVSAIPADTANTGFDASKIQLATDCIVSLVTTDAPGLGMPRDYPIKATPGGLCNAATMPPRNRSSEFIGSIGGADTAAAQLVLREGEGMAVRAVAIPLIHPGRFGDVALEVIFTVEDNTPPPSGGAQVAYSYAGG